LRAWIAVLAAVWLLLLAALLFRGLGETPFPAEALERSNDIAAAEPSPDSSLDAALESREGVAARGGVRADADERVPRAGRMSESAPPATVVAEPEATSREAVPGGAPALSGRVFFQVNSTSVDAQFEPVLEEIAQALLAHPQAYAEVIGYTDRSGALEYNIALSRQRARSVANRLMLRGVAAERIVIEGQGPRDFGSDAAISREQGRVVEITVR